MSNNDYELVKKLADYMVIEGTENTSSGNYIFYLDELSTRFGITVEWLLGHTDDILDALHSHEEVLDDIWNGHDDNGVVTDFDINFGTKYCQNLDREGGTV